MQTSSEQFARLDPSRESRSGVVLFSFEDGTLSPGVLSCGCLGPKAQ